MVGGGWMDGMQVGMMRCFSEVLRLFRLRRRRFCVTGMIRAGGLRRAW